MAVKLSKYISGIRIESAFLPEIYLPDPFAPNKVPNPFLSALKPKITVETKDFGNQIMSPYGEPGPSMWPAIRNAILIAGGLFLLRKLLK